MKPDLTRLSTEELKRMLHTENFKFNQGIERNILFNDLKQIRESIRAIPYELEHRNQISASRRTHSDRS